MSRARISPAVVAAEVRACADDLAIRILHGDHLGTFARLQWLVGRIITLWRQADWQPPSLDDNNRPGGLS